ncbi:hypothetical protein CK203_063360 [Vitis vinifera]|uniref:Uncharacterized protein n=1 Tax=Vitis vinifera TaxID=29760 RepID=A0A438G6P2_VITVI|nr:hypothetical protein CK203_063360 [Vitis vinifera]
MTPNEDRLTQHSKTMWCEMLLEVPHLMETTWTSISVSAACGCLFTLPNNLLPFKQSFLIDGHASDDPSAYPKVAMWKSHREGEGEGKGSDCCSWDGVECDRETGHVIGLHLASSCLYGSINSSNTLFSSPEA